MAHLSRDEGLLTAFAAGEDIHRATASEIFGCERGEVTSEQRRYAKVINFGLIYGMSAFGLAGQLGVDRAAAQSYIDRYFVRYPASRATCSTRALQPTRKAGSKPCSVAACGCRDQQPQRHAPRRRAAAINAHAGTRPT